MKFLRVGLLQIFIIHYLTGCTAGLVMFAVDKRSFGEFADDTAITSSINVKYLSDELVSALDINVDTYRGVVTLYGLVANQAAARQAVDIALSTENVTRVLSYLTIRNQALTPLGVVYQ
jgi:hyperosmotically inducible protein